MIIAGEASGDLHGAELVRAMQARDPQMRFLGIGGTAMAAAGVDIRFEAAALSVVGITEVIPKLPQILKGLRTVRRILARETPDLLILIDFPDFNLMAAKAAKRAEKALLRKVLDPNYETNLKQQQALRQAQNEVEKLEAERACLLFGNVRIQAFEKYKEELGKINHKDNVAYKYIDFKDGVKSFTVNAKAINGGRISICLDQPWHKEVGFIDIPAGDGKTWQEFTGEIKDVQGVHALWINFYGEGADLLSLDWIQFSK